MVIAAFQRIRGLIGYRFGDVMRLIIEPAAGARQGRPTGWPVGGLASRTANALYTPRAPSFFFVTGGQRRSVTRSDHFQDGEARVTSTVVGRSPLQSSYVANERDFYFFFFFNTRVHGSVVVVVVVGSPIVFSSDRRFLIFTRFIRWQYIILYYILSSRRRSPQCIIVILISAAATTLLSLSLLLLLLLSSSVYYCRTPRLAAMVSIS